MFFFFFISQECEDRGGVHQGTPSCKMPGTWKSATESLIKGLYWITAPLLELQRRTGLSLGLTDHASMPQVPPVPGHMRKHWDKDSALALGRLHLSLLRAKEHGRGIRKDTLDKILESSLLAYNKLLGHFQSKALHSLSRNKSHVDGPK